MTDIVEYEYRSSGADPRLLLAHRHADSCEIIQIVSGSGTVLIGEKIFPFLPGAMYFIPNECQHSTRPINVKNYVRNKMSCSIGYMTALLSACGAETALELYRTGGGMISLSPKQASEADMAFQDMCRAIRKEQKHEKMQVSAMLVKLSILISSGHMGAPDYDGNAELGKIIQYLNEHLEAQVTTRELARMFYMSDSRLCRVFKARTGSTITGYVLEQRLTKARNMLTFSDKNVTNIAQACGFESLAYFSKAFKRAEGVSPLRYRRSVRDER